MAGLVIKLGPKERILVNGAVLENGDRRSRLSVVSPNANILRLKDAIHPEDAKTPVRRLCYTAQLVLTGDVEAADIRGQLLSGIEQLSQVFRDPDSKHHLEMATSAILDSQHYRLLKSLKSLIPREDRLIAVGQM